MRPKCDFCGMSADFNFQENWVIFSIEDSNIDGEYDYWYNEIESDNIGENYHLCKNCAEKEGYI